MNFQRVQALMYWSDNNNLKKKHQKCANEQEKPASTKRQHHVFYVDLIVTMNQWYTIEWFLVTP